MIESHRAGRFRIRIRGLMVVVALIALLVAGGGWLRARNRYLELARYHHSRAVYHQGSAQFGFVEGGRHYETWKHSRAIWLGHLKASEAYAAAARRPWMAEPEPFDEWPGRKSWDGTVLPCPDDDTIVP